MKINFLEVAQYELEDAIDYYNYELPGLGEDGSLPFFCPLTSDI